MDELKCPTINAWDRAYRTFLSNSSDACKIASKTLRNNITRAVRNAKRLLFIERARIGTRQFWRNIKLCTGFGKIKSFRVPWPCANLHSSTVSANKVNKHFADSIAKIVTNISQTLPRIFSATDAACPELFDYQD